MNISVATNQIPASSPDALAAAYALEKIIATCPQHKLETHHVIHGGMYARSITMKAGEILTGALINVPTMLIIHGDARVLIGKEVRILTGFNVIPASAGRKQAFIALTDLDMTMIFATSAQTVADAEEEFTHEAELLMSRHNGNANFVTITGE